MLRKLLILSLLLITLAFLPGCIIHDPGFYPNDSIYYSETYYPYYYGPYLYTPFWFSGYYNFGYYGREHDFKGHRGFERHGRSGRGQR